MKTKIHTNPHLIMLLLFLCIEAFSLFGSATEIVVFMGVMLFEFIYFAIENEIIKWPRFKKPAYAEIKFNNQPSPKGRKRK